MAKEACPPTDGDSGRGPLAASYRAAMTQMTMGGIGANKVSGVLSGASCRQREKLIAGFG